MFRKSWGNGVISDSGFAVKFKWPHNVEYREGEKSLTAYMEMLSGDYQVYLDSRSIRRWKPPFQDEILPAEKKQEILNNICAGLDFLGLKYIVR